ncbi:MAG: hypothetical protein ACD_76C00052G0006 [uncultured bacterium]|nr:MAG: hypothetical protein ACD_76C00052G0006 [uncultured bacterium]HBD05625.1 hypothetical protein [Candidatus Uhrbacteria bacterium]
MQKLIRELEDFGLTEKEAQVYLSVLQLGAGGVKEISKDARVNRATTYLSLESLMARGLVSSIERDGKKEFAAESPERFLTVINLQKEELNTKEKYFYEILPQLLAFYNESGQKPEIRYLVGLEGLRTIQLEYERLRGPVIQIIPHDALRAVLPDMAFLNEHRKEVARLQEDIRAIILTDDKNSDPGIPNEPNFCFLPAKDFPNITSEIIVKRDYIFIMSYKTDIIGIIIKSKSIADTLRLVFELAWKSAKRIEEKNNQSVQ